MGEFRVQLIALELHHQVLRPGKGYRSSNGKTPP
jgi:hypothetical protein